MAEQQRNEYRGEHVVEATWVLYGGTEYEERQVIEVRCKDLADALTRAREIRTRFSAPDETRADRHYVESASARTDLIPPNNSPELDVVMEGALFNEAYKDEYGRG